MHTWYKGELEEQKVIVQFPCDLTQACLKDFFGTRVMKT